MKKFIFPYTALPALAQFSKRLTDTYINSNTGLTIQSTLSAFQREQVPDIDQLAALTTEKRKEMPANFPSPTPWTA